MYSYSLSPYVSIDIAGDVHIVAVDDGQLLQYNETTGQWENTDLSDLGITLGVDTSGNYVIDVSAGTGVTVTHTQGEGSTPTISIGQAVATTDSPTFAGVTADNIRVGITGANEIDTVSGNLTIDSAGGTVTVDDNVIINGDVTINGAATTIHTETLTVDDNLIVLNNNVTGTPTENAGIEIERGTSANVSFRWNETDGKWEYTEDGSVFTQLGSAVTSYVRNADSVTLTAGTVVYLFGATGDHASVKRADNDSDTTSSKTVGMISGSIAPGANGTVVTRGYVRGMDLSVGYTAGDILWLGEDGGFTKVKPVAPEHLVFVGVVVRATNNGIVYVAVQNGFELDELHNVQINPLTLANGSALVYNSGTGLWENGAAASLVKSDFVSPYSYIGVAVPGTADATAAWRISRIEITTGYPVTVATGVAWTDRLTAIYT